MHKKHLLISFTIALGLLVAIGALSWVLDPYQRFHDQLVGQQQFSTRMRLQAPGLIRMFIEEGGDVDTVIMGASLSQNYDEQLVAEAVGGREALQLSLSGGAPREQMTVLRQALANGKVRNVFLGIHELYLRDPEFLGHEDFPEQMYGPLPLKYLFSLDTLGTAFSRLAGRTQWEPSGRGLSNWMDEQRPAFAQFNSPENLERLRAKLAEKRSSATTLSTGRGEREFPSLDRHLLALVRERPDVRFHCVLPPYSTLYFALLGPEELDTLFSMEAQLVEQAQSLPNLTVYNFQDEFTVMDNLANYRDTEHFSAAVSDWIVRSIRDGRRPVDPKEWDAAQARIIRHAGQYDVMSDKGTAY